METFKKSVNLANELKNWLNAHPESEHQLDRERWYKVISKSILLNESIDFDEINNYIKEKKQWIEEFRNQFIERKELEYFLIRDFIIFHSKQK